MTKVAFYGIQGAYTHQALLGFTKKYNLDVEAIDSEGLFSDLFKDIEKVGFGMLPIENSTAGSVIDAYTEFLKHDFEILGEYKMKIDHVLLAKENINEEE